MTAQAKNEFCECKRCPDHHLQWLLPSHCDFSGDIQDPPGQGPLQPTV